MICSIQYLRGIAAILVVLYHARGALDFSFGNIPNVGDFLFAHGYFGVDLFFIISGFVIVLSTQNDTSITSFLLKRIFRVYPLYLFCLLCILFFAPEHYSLHDIIRALFLIQSNYSQPAPWFGYSIVFVAWTLSFEVLFYLIFCLAMYISHKYRVVLSSLIIALMTCGVTVIFGGNLSLDGYASLDNNFGVLRFISSPMFFEFISGMMISIFYINRDKFHYLKPFVPFISSVGLFYFILFYWCKWRAWVIKLWLSFIFTYFFIITDRNILWNYQKQHVINAW